jgi:Gpi18-like mannosyltransferase
VALGLSNVAFFGALVYLWRLTSWELGNRTATRTILYIATFPTALFFFAGYTESLFLFLTVACFFHLRRHDWLLSGCYGACASATRVTGILLVLPLAYEYARSCNFSPRRMFARGAMALVLVPSGLLAFMIYLQVTVGDALAFSHDQAAWQKITTPRLWAGLLESVRQIVLVQPSASFFQAHNLINVAAALVFLVVTALAARRFPASYTIYLVAFWLVTLTTPAMARDYPVPFISMSRYVLVLFPIFMYFGLLGARRQFHDSYLVLCTALLSLFTVQFITGGWII